MKVLVTGAGGFLGRRIVASLLHAGVRDIRCQLRQLASADALQRIANAVGQPTTLEIIECNLLSQSDADALLNGVDLVIHAAAGTRGAAADMMLNTVVASRNLLESALRARVHRMVLVSSFAVYDTTSLARGATLDEHSPIEASGLEKGAYAMSKVRQEALFEHYQRRAGFELVKVRPGVIYGPGGAALSSRVGIRALGLYFNLGGSRLLPLSQVENCADAVVIAALRGVPGANYNAVDDELPSCSSYLRAYRKRVERLRVIPVPYPLLAFGARCLVWYSRRSKGQLPAILTPYIVRSMYRDIRYSNDALKAIGWNQRTSTSDGIDRMMDYLAAQRAG